MTIAIIVVVLMFLAAAAFGLTVAWDSIKPVEKHPDINRIQWPANHEETANPSRRMYRDAR